MSAFWELWSKADAGDVEAAHQVNVLVAKRVGLDVRITDGSTFGWSSRDSWMDEWIALPDGEDKPIPDYMSDLNAAAGLSFPAHGKLEIKRHCANGVYQDWCVKADGDFKSAVYASANLARAFVASWWFATTRERRS